MSPEITIAAVLAAVNAAFLGYCIRGARAAKQRRRGNIPSGSNETFGPTDLDEQWEQICAVLGQDPAFRPAWCPRPALHPYATELAARAAIREQADRRGRRVRRCECGCWHVIHVRPRAQR